MGRAACIAVSLSLLALPRAGATWSDDPSCEVQVSLARGARLRLRAAETMTIPGMAEFAPGTTALLAPNAAVFHTDNDTVTLLADGSGLLLTIPKPGHVLKATLVSFDDESVTVTLDGAAGPCRLGFATLASAALWDDEDERWLEFPLGPLPASLPGVTFKEPARFSRTPVKPLIVTALRADTPLSVAAEPVVSAPGMDMAHGYCDSTSPMGPEIAKSATGQPEFACPGRSDPLKGPLVAMTEDHWRILWDGPSSANRGESAWDKAETVVDVPRRAGTTAHAHCGSVWLPVMRDAALQRTGWSPVRPVSAGNANTVAVHARLAQEGSGQLRPSPEPAPAPPSKDPAACPVRVVLTEGSQLRVVAWPVRAISDELGRTGNVVVTVSPMPESRGLTVPRVVQVGSALVTSGDPAAHVFRNDRNALYLRERDGGPLIAFPPAGREETLTDVAALDSESITGTLSGAPRRSRIPLAALERIELRYGEKWLGLALGPVQGAAHGLTLTGEGRLSLTPSEPFEVVKPRPHARMRIGPRAPAPPSAAPPPPGQCGPPDPLGVTVRRGDAGQPAVLCPGRSSPVKGTLLDATDTRWRLRQEGTGRVVDVPRQPDLAARTECAGSWFLVADDALP